MSNSITQAIQGKIKYWKNKLADDSNSNPLLNFQKSEKLRVDIDTPPSILFKDLAGDESRPVPIRELRTKQTDAELTTLLEKLRQNAKSTLEEKGFNSLFLVLGTLTWLDADKPKEKFVYPLLLIPVQLQKKGKKPPEYTLHPVDEEISLNFLLVNKLRDEFNISLPESDRVQELGYEKFLDAVRSAIAQKPNWKLEDTAHITLFQETKAAMIQDLQQNEKRIAAHPILQGLALKKIPDNFNSPNLIKEKELDQIPPSSLYQICDADSSQQVVIEAAKAGLSCVVQGPPGTGKSQTIANIMAELMGKHKKVLLVAEKQTALEVVSGKFQKCSLEDVCLNLHHQGTTNTKDLLEELNKTMSRLSQSQESQQQNRDVFFQKLCDRRQTLNQYVASLHENQPPLNKSAYDLYGELLKLEREEVPSLEFHVSNIQNWSEDCLLEANNLLDELGKFEPFFRGTQTTIWSSSPVQSWSSDVNTELRQNLENLDQGVQLAQKTATRLRQLFGIQQLANTLADLDRLQPAIGHVVTVPPVPRGWPLVNDVNALRRLFIELSTDLSNIQNISSALNAKYTSEFFTWNLPDLKKLSDRHRRYRGIFRWLRPGYWNNRKRLLAVRQVKHRVSDQELIADIENVIEQKNILNTLADPAHPARRAFGLLFDTEMPDLDGIEQALNWLEGLQQYQLRLPFKGIAAVISSDERLQEVRTLLENLETSQNLVKQGFQFLRRHFGQHRITALGVLEKTSLQEVKNFLDTAKAELDLFQQLLYCRQQVRKLEAIGAKEFLSKLRESKIQPKFWFSVLQKGIYQNWLRHILSDNSQLQHFRENSHEQKIEEFSQLDPQQYQEAIKRLQQLHTERWREWSVQPQAKQQIQRLKREREKKKGHQKIREFIKNAPELVTTLKPCWLMSPLAVSQYVDPDAVEFDVIIFDEASQVRTEDAVPSIMRAKQLIVVGDDRQLPPTSFFKSTASDDEEDEDQEVYDSLLNECSTFLPDFTLRWHYRSKDESLIAFSNQKFYNSELLTFPNPVKDASRGVHFHYVEGGIYAPGKQQRHNIPEAKKVAELTLQHCQQNSDQSLGIITLNKQQSEAIREQLNQLIVKYPEIEEFCQENSEKFFIKPLELVQGDQRDVIFLSFGYGFYENDRDKLYHFFGPLTKQGGRRRLNVAITRALYKFVLVASIKAEHLKPEGKLEEVALLKDYFAYAESCGEKLPDKLDDDVSSDLLFEEDVYQALTQRGYTLKKRVGRSAYPIDLAVINNRRPETEEFLLGIVCDGAIYKEYPTARDRDRLRQKVLQDLGWRIHRIWSSEWFRDRNGQINRLVSLIEHLRNQE